MVNPMSTKPLKVVQRSWTIPFPKPLPKLLWHLETLHSDDLRDTQEYRDIEDSYSKHLRGFQLSEPSILPISYPGKKKSPVPNTPGWLSWIFGRLSGRR